MKLDIYTYSYLYTSLGTTVLQWWAKHAPVFPKLAKVARRFLSVQATSAASERVFSRSGGVSTKIRNRLNGETLQMLTFLRDNKDLTKQYLTREGHWKVEIEKYMKRKRGEEEERDMLAE